MSLVADGRGAPDCARDVAAADAAVAPSCAAAAAALAERLERLSGLPVLCSSDGIDCAASPAFVDWYGGAPANLASAWQRLPESARSLLAQHIAAARATGASFDCALPGATHQADALRVRGEWLPGAPCALLAISLQPGSPALAPQAPDPAAALARPATVLAALRDDSPSRRLAQRLMLVTAGHDIGIWEIEATTGRVYWNAQMQALYGVRPGETPPNPGAWLERHLLAEDRERVLRTSQFDLPADAQDWQELRTRRIEHRVVRGDGSVIWVESQSMPLVEHDGRRLIMGTAHDITRRKRDEHDLREALQRLQMATDWAQVGVFIRDPATGSGYWNRQMYLFYGLDPDAFGGAPPPFATVAERIHPDDRARYLTVWNSLVDGGTAQFSEQPIRLLPAPGQLRWVTTRGRRLHPTAGGDVRVAGVVIDITERMQSEQRAEQTADRLERASAAGRIGVAERDLRTGEGYWNRTMFELVGLQPRPHAPSREELVAMTHPDDVAAVEAAWARLVATDAPIEFDSRYVAPDGTARWFRTRGHAERDAEGRVIRVLGTAIDVTELRAASERLALALQRLQLATEAGGVGLWERDLATGVAKWDASMFAIFDQDPPDPPTHDAFRARVYPDDLAWSDTWWQRLQESSSALECEMRLLRRDGSITHVVTRGVVERDGDGRPVRAFGTCVDVSAIRSQEAQQRATAERLALAQRTSGLGLWEMDVATQRIEGDARTYEIFGLEPGSELHYETCMRRVHPDDVDGLRERQAATLASDADEAQVDFRVVRTDGTVRHVEERYAIERGPDGRARRLLGTLLDVTHLRRTERERETLFERLQLAMATARMGVWERVLPGETEIWDERMREIYGVSADWAPSRSAWLTMVHPEDRPRLVADLAVQDASSGGVFGYRIVRADGQVRYVEDVTRIERDHDDHVTRMLGVQVDVTEARKAQIERDQLSERLRMAAAALGFGVFEWVPHEHLSDWSDEMYALFGYTRESFRDKTWIDAIHPDDRDSAKALLDGIVEHGSSFGFEYRVRWPDGTVRWIANRGHILRDADGRALRVTGLNWDITESKRADASLRAKEAAERANAAKTEFLSRMSHELRTPLNAILGFTQLLEVDPGQPLSPLQADRVGHIRTAGWHLLTLINEVLDLSQIESGAARLERSPVALQPALERCVALLRADADRRGIAIEIAADDPGITAWADPVRLKQVLLNLLSNAVKYNRERGRVQVQIAMLADGQVSIAVRDTGRGIPAAQLDELFQPFNRLGAEAAGIEGTGIGLTICRKLVEQMDGRILVSSEAGVGSEFRVVLRAASVAAAAAVVSSPTPAQARAPAPAQTACVLYVDDDASNRLLVESVLRKRPTVQLCTSADRPGALACAQHHPPALVLLDLTLGDTDGVTLLHELRAMPQLAQSRFIAVSGHALPTDKQRALAAGFDDYLVKPLRLAELLRRVDETFGIDSSAF